MKIRCLLRGQRLSIGMTPGGRSIWSSLNHSDCCSVMAGAGRRFTDPLVQMMLAALPPPRFDHPVRGECCVFSTDCCRHHLGDWCKAVQPLVELGHATLSVAVRLAMCSPQGSRTRRTSPLVSAPGEHPAARARSPPLSRALSQAAAAYNEEKASQCQIRVSPLQDLTLPARPP